MKTTRKIEETRGSRAVARLVKKYRAAPLAKMLRVSARAVLLLASGERQPSAKIVARLSALYDIPATAWAKGGEASSSTPAPEPPRERETVGTTLEEAEALVGRLKADVSALAKDATASARDRAQTAAALSQALRQLSKLRGEEEISEARIAKSAAWGRLVGALVDASKDCAPCLERLAKVCERLDGEAQTSRGEP